MAASSCCKLTADGCQLRRGPRAAPLWLLGTAALLLAFPAPAQVRSSANYAITTDGFVAGGGTSASANYTLRGSFGLAFATPPMAGANYSNQSGLLVAIPAADTAPASIPTGLSATAISSSWINLGWTASTDAVGVSRYQVFRDGVFRATVTAPATGFDDTGLAPATIYSYTVAACDSAGAGNCSAPSAAASATTPAVTAFAAAAVAAGAQHSLALKADGTVVAWGDNGQGQSTVPAGLAGVVAIGAGLYHSIALKSDGTVVAWGNDSWGQVTVPPAAQSGVVAIAAGQYHSLAAKSDGTVVAWGLNNNGQSTAPAGLGGVMAVSAGEAHSLALKSDGTVVAWGFNSDGRSTVPAGLTGVVSIAAGQSNSLAAKSDGTLMAWGDNSQGQSAVPAGLTGVAAVAAGFIHAIALKSDGTVVAWGNDGQGQLAVPAGLTGVVMVAAGGSHSLALKSDGTVVAWGMNNQGQSTVPAGLSVPADSQAPSVPASLVATAVGASRIDLAWNASTDNLAVAAYQVFRGGVFRASTAGLGLSDTGLPPSTGYSYTVAACDAAGNCSAKSMPAMATTAPLGLTYTAILELGFNLISNALNLTIDVPASFGNQDAPVSSVTPNIVSIWKWNAVDGRWAFYSPQLTVAAIASFAGSKGYDVLATINPGEGYWVNALNPITLPSQTGAAFNWTSIAFASLPSGFNLIAQANERTPSEFNNDMNPTPPSPGEVPTTNFLSLWGWDAAAANWYFYSPLLEASSGLQAVKDYADSHFYLHFQDFNRKVGLGVGFWVNRP